MNSTAVLRWVFPILSFVGCASPPVTGDVASDVQQANDTQADTSSGNDVIAPTDVAMPTDATTDVNNPVDTAVVDAAMPTDVPTASPEFTTLYNTVLVANCRGSGCHVPPPGEPPASYPVLQMPDPASARAALINRNLECRSTIPGANDRIRVVPSDPMMSAIMMINADGLCGRRHNILLPPTFTASDLAAIEAWIAGGAR